MKRPRQHEIDEEAQNIFRSQMPMSWVCQPQVKDYARDYLVEVVDDAELTGRLFFVQLKGTSAAKRTRKGEHFVLRIESRHVKYFINKTQQPLFIVLVDLPSKAAYWVFVQEYVDNQSKTDITAWLERKSVTIHVPAANVLSDHARLRSAVSDAEAYMRKKYPGHVHDAIKAEELRLERLDPRLSIQVEASGGSVRSVVHAKENVSFALNIQGEPALVQQSYRELLEKGTPVDLTGLQAHFSGSPVFEGQRVLQIQAERSLPMEVQIGLIDDSGAETCRIGPVHGALKGGTVEQRFEGRLGSSPLIVHARITRANSNGERSTAQCTFSFELRRWLGIPLEALPYFEQVRSLTEHLARGGSLLWSLSVEGNTILESRGRFPLDETIEHAYRYCQVIQIAREVSKWTGISATAKAEMSTQELDDLIKVWRLSDPLNRVEPYENQAIEMELPPSLLASILENTHPFTGDLGSVGIACDLPPMLFMGQQVQACGFSAEVSAARLDHSEFELRSMLDSATGTSIKVRARSTANAVLTMAHCRIQPL